MTKLLRFKDLKERGIVENRATLGRWISAQGFPPGFLVGPNSRAWSEADISTWLAQRVETHAEKVKPRTSKRSKAVEAVRT